MKHLGDITLIHGNEIEPVDCIIGGSPCQDLSVAGKRAGLSGERSGLFMEQIRIVKEMRNRYGKPRYMVWENVPGAFSSNSGEDFRAVLEEITKIADETAVIPRPPKGKWSCAGCVMGDGWSVAWRTHDAQFWGVPQRRRRIALVADFGGESAPEILFEREGLRGYFEKGRTPWEGITADAQGSPHADDREGECLSLHLTQAPIVSDKHTPCISAGNSKNGQAVIGICYPEIANTLAARHDGSPQPDKGNGANIIVIAQNRRDEVRSLGDKAGALTAEPGMKQQTFVVEGEPVYRLQGNGIDRADTAGCNGRGWRKNVSYTLNTIDRPAVCYDMTHANDVIRDGGHICPTLQGWMGTGGNQVPICIGNGQADQLRMSDKVGALNCMHDQQCVMLHNIVRRLTPLECERLQGYPDGWTDIGDWTDIKGKLHKAADAPRYKALGNSIALPFWGWMLHRMAGYLPIGATMGSLFDGIGGFPLLWERIHGAGTARWASEIEEFAIAVTKIRFTEGEEE